MKKKILVLYIIIALVLVCSNVYATVTTDLSLTRDKEKVKAGEDVIISVNLRNLSKNIASVTGYIDIDENVLNGISEDMIVKNNAGKIEVTSNGTVLSTLSYAYAPTEPTDVDVIFNTNSAATEGHDVFFTEDFKQDLSNDSIILQLKVTVKQGVNSGDLEKAVKITDLVAESTSTSQGTTTSDKSEKLSADVTITVDNTVPIEPTPSNNTENENTNNTNTNNTNTNTNTNNTNTNTNKNTNTNNTNTNTNNTNTNTNKNTNTNTNTKDNTVSGSRLPATGAGTIIIPGLVLCLLGFISYRKYMNYKEIK